MVSKELTTTSVMASPVNHIGLTRWPMRSE